MSKIHSVEKIYATELEDPKYDLQRKCIMENVQMGYQVD